jgi:hypothetical protein
MTSKLDCPSASTFPWKINEDLTQVRRVSGQDFRGATFSEKADFVSGVVVAIK